MSMNLVASNYGMNFELMPELKRATGYPLALGGMLMVGSVLFVYFRSRRWI